MTPTTVTLTLDEMKSMAILYRDANLIHSSPEMTKALFATDAKIHYHVTYGGKNLDLDLNVEEMMKHLQDGQYNNTVTSEVLEESFEVVGPNTLKYDGKAKTTRLGHGLIEEKDKATYMITSSIVVSFTVTDGRILIQELTNTYTKELVVDNSSVTNTTSVTNTISVPISDHKKEFFDFYSQMCSDNVLLESSWNQTETEVSDGKIQLAKMKYKDSTMTLYLYEEDMVLYIKHIIQSISDILRDTNLPRYKNELSELFAFSMNHLYANYQKPIIVRNNKVGIKIYDELYVSNGFTLLSDVDLQSYNLPYANKETHNFYIGYHYH